MTSTPSRGLPAAVGFMTVTRLVMNTSHRFVYPYLPAIARGLGIPLTTAGLLVSVRSLAGLATPIVVGTVGRAGGRRRLMTFALALFTIGALVTAAWGALGGAITGFLLLGLAKPVFDLAAQAYIADRTPYERRARYLSVLELTWAGSLLVGAPTAGWLIDRSGWEAPFVLFAVSGLVALAVVAWLIDPDEAASTERVRIRGHLDVSARALLAAAFLFSFAAENTFVVVGAWLEDRFALSLVALGSAAVVVALAELAGEGATLAFADRLGKKRAVVIGLSLSVVGFVALWPTATSLGPGLAVFAFTFAAFELTIVSAIPLATEAVPLQRTAYLAWIMVAVGSARAIGSAAGPVLFEAGGFALNTMVSAGVDLIAIAILVRWVTESPSIAEE